MKKLLSLVLIIVSFTLVGCSSEKGSENTSNTSNTSSVSSKGMDSSEAELAVASVLNERLNPSFTVRVDSNDKTFYVRPIDDDISEEIFETAEGSRDITDWKVFSESLESFGRSINSELGSGYTILVENPYNSSKYILTIYEGEVVDDSVSASAGYDY